MKEKEIYYGRELFKAMRQFVPQGLRLGERRLKNGLIEIEVFRSYEKRLVGINPLLQIGRDTPIKAEDLKELCIEAGKKIDELISKIENNGK